MVRMIDLPRLRFACLLRVIPLLAPGAATAVTVDFEDVGAALAPGGYVNDSQGFTSRGVGLNNQFTDFGGGFTTWGGFSYANIQDSVTPGYGNQYAAYHPSSSGAVGTHGVGFVDSFVPVLPRITFATDVQAASAKIANTTYVALSMRDGDAFAKKFGGASGHDPDFFELTIEGFDAGGASTGHVDVALADFRFADDALDYIVSDFLPVDLSGLGLLRSLEFTLRSSDNGDFGMNTPAYFAIDDIVAVPEASPGVALGLGVMALARARRQLAGRATA